MLTENFDIDIPNDKIEGYLLNPKHPDGWGKARFFVSHNFTSANDLTALLFGVISNNKFSEEIKTEYGTKYVVDGFISKESKIMLRTVWIVLNGENLCRFVTAYPL